MECKKKNPDWLRIECVMEYLGFRSVNAFATRLGLKRAENLFQIKKGNHGISRKLAARIHARYPQLSPDWLRFGAVRHEDHRSGNVPVPYYRFLPLMFEFKLNNSPSWFHSIPDKWLLLPKSVVNHAVFALYCREETLMPLFFKGDILLLRPVADREVIYDRAYVIHTDREVVLSLVQPGYRTEEIRLVTHFPETIRTVKREIIRNLYAVCSSFRYHGMPGESDFFDCGVDF